MSSPSARRNSNGFISLRSSLGFARALVRAVAPLWLALAAFACFMASARPAHAYAWTIRYGYQQCGACHVDPSGAGTLTRYGRAVMDESLRTRWSKGPADEDEDGARIAAFAFAVKLPKPLMLQADARYMRLAQKVEQTPFMKRGIWMQLDFAAALKLGAFTASGSVGFAPEGARAAALTSTPENNVVSRTHWLGYGFANDALQVRLGRMNLPFGLRIHEHTTWVRSFTRTNIDDQQQYGVSVAYSGPAARAEAMFILGNFALSPDSYRERGYSAYGEWFATPRLTAGASSLLTHRTLDPGTHEATYRHAHGLFTRFATPWEPLVLMAEGDFVLESPRRGKRRQGIAALVQADVEVSRGIHLIATTELANVGVDEPPLSYGAWLSYAWFFAPHADLRVDSIWQRFGSKGGDLDAITWLLQAHVYL